MHIGSIRLGDTLVCCHCDYERIVAAAWIEAVCRKFFEDRIPALIHDFDPGRFRCSSCRRKSLLKRSQKSAPGYGSEAALSRAFKRFVGADAMGPTRLLQA